MVPRDLDLPAVAGGGGTEFLVDYGTGSLADYEERVTDVVRERASGNAVGIAGHPHEVPDEVVDGVRPLKPRSGRGAAPAKRATVMAVVEGWVTDVTVHEAYQPE